MKLDPKKTAVLTLDFQKGIFDFAPASETIVPTAAKVIDFGRKKGFTVIHVGLGFSPGHPEISDRESRFLMVKKNNLFVKGSPSGEFHRSLVHPSDLVIYKQRVGAFSENELHLTLRARHIENLVFFGISTSGIVLSTIRRAFDLDFQNVVIKDACFDPDPEIHRVLTEKIFPGQASVFSAEAFISEQGD